MEPGDLVYVDTDTVGIEGYFFCVSRTFLCGDAPPTAGAARHVPGRVRLAGGDEGARAPGPHVRRARGARAELPEKYLPQRYECMIHGIGLEEESPSVCYPIDPQSNADRVIERT